MIKPTIGNNNTTKAQSIFEITGIDEVKIWNRAQMNKIKCNTPKTE